MVLFFFADHRSAQKKDHKGLLIRSYHGIWLLVRGEFGFPNLRCPWASRFQLVDWRVHFKSFQNFRIVFLLLFFCFFFFGCNSHFLQTTLCLTPLPAIFQFYIMTTNFCGGRSRCTWREPPTMGEQLVNFITCGFESSIPFLRNLQNRARTHAVLVIGLYELLGNLTT